MPKRKFQPNRDKIQKKQGFLKRMASKNGRTVIRRRKQRGRKKLTK